MGKGKTNDFSLCRHVFFPVFESDIAGVKIWCRIYSINVNISTALKKPLARGILTYI